MKPTANTIRGKARLGWILLGVSIILVGAGFGIQFFNPALKEGVQWVIGLGILALGSSIALLSMYLPAGRSPEAAVRRANSEADERNVAIRNAAGYIAFLASVVVNYIVLFVYSSLTRGAGFDPLWYTLAFLAIFPILVFILFKVRYQKRM